MDEDGLQSKVPRQSRLFVGVGVAGVSGLFAFLFLYFLFSLATNVSFSIGKLVFVLFIGVIALSLATWSYRLIKGRGIKGSDALLSNTALWIWGTVFGVSGIIMFFSAWYLSEPAYLFTGTVGVFMGLGGYQLAKQRNKK